MTTAPSAYTPALDVTVHGQPVGKGRPRVALRGNRPIAYSPDTTVAWEDRAAHLLRLAWGGRVGLDRPVEVQVEVVCRRPKAKTRRSDPVGRIPCLTKPDIDNVAKIALDALVLAGVLVDDTRVVRLVCSKEYTALYEQEHVRIVVGA